MNYILTAFSIWGKCKFIFHSHWRGSAMHLSNRTSIPSREVDNKRFDIWEKNVWAPQNERTWKSKEAVILASMFCNVSLLGSEVKSELFLLGGCRVPSTNQLLLLSVSYVGPWPPFHFQNKNRTNCSIRMQCIPKYIYPELVISSTSCRAIKANFFFFFVT